MKISASKITFLLIVVMLTAMLLFACSPEENNLYKVDFEVSGGDAVESQMTRYIEKSPMPSKQGFVFEGWYTSADFSGKLISFPYEVIQDVTLYARWITAAKGSPGLIFASEDEAYSVIGYDGGSHIVLIPPTYLEMPVNAIADGAFNNCRTVTKISVPSSVLTIGKAFSRCNNLFEISINTANPNYKSVDGVLYSLDGSRLVSYPPAKQGKAFTVPESVVGIDNSALRFCHNLESVLISKNVEEIEKNFEGCYALNNIEVDSENSVYKSIGGVLFTKDGKTLVRYPHDFSQKNYLIPEGTQSVGEYAFNGSSIQKLTLAASLTQFGYVEDCKNLTEFSVHAENSEFMSIGGALFNKTATTLLQYPQAKLGAPYKNDGDDKEYYSYHLPDGIEKINSWAFNSCLRLNKIFLPSSLVEIAPYAFTNLNEQFELTEIVFSAGSRLEKIGETAFMDIPLRLIKLTALIPPLVEEETFVGVAEDLKIFVPTDTKNLYDSSDWGKLATLIDGGAEQSYAINFITGGGTAVEEVKTAFLATEPKPQKQNNVFGGWYLDGGFYRIAAFPIIPTEDISLYAKWYSAASGTDGLQFSLQTATQTYSVSGYNGNVATVEVPPTFNGKIVSTIGASAFAGKTHITSLTLPETITEIKDSAFEGGYNAEMRLENIVFQGNTLKKIGNYAFRYCRKLKTVSLPQGLESVGSYAFDNCYSMTEINLPKNISSLGFSVFSNCPQLAEIAVDSANENFADKDGVLYNKAMTKLIRYPAAKADQSFALLESVTDIESEAFHSAVNLKEISLGSVKNIGVKAFHYCPLTSVSIPNTMTTFNPSVFANTPLKSITLGANVAQIEDYFHSLDNLEEITVDSSNANFCSVEGVLYSIDKKTLLRFPKALEGNYIIPQEAETIAQKAFFECRIKTLSLNDNLKVVGTEAFSNCRLESITLNEALTEIGEAAFLSSALRSVYLSSNVYPVIGRNVFAGTDAWIYAPQEIIEELTTAGWGDDIYSNTVITEGLHLLLLDDYYKVIKVLSSQDETTLPSKIGDTEIRQIGRGAFSPSVKRINIPSTVKKLDSYAFSGCGSLTTIVFEGEGQEIGSNAFFDCPMLTNIVFGGAPPVLNGVLPEFFRLNVFVPAVEEYSSTDFAKYNLFSSDSIKDYWAYANDSATIFAYLGVADEITVPSTVDGVAIVLVAEYALNPNVKSLTVSSGISLADNAFSGQPYRVPMGLKKLVFEGEGAVSIGKEAFYGLDIEEIVLPTGLTSIEGDSFRHNDGLKSISISAMNDSYCSIDGVLFDKTAEKIIRCPQGKNAVDYSLPQTVKTVGRYAFAQSKLIAVRLSQSVSTVESYAFEACEILDLAMPEGMLRLEPFALKGCEKLIRLDLPLYFNEFDSSAVIDCSSLRIIYAPTQNDTYLSVDGVLFDKSGNTLISYPGGRKGAYTIPATVTSIAPYAFFGSRLESVTIPENVSAIGKYAFAYNLSLKSIDTGNVTVLSEGMLKGCTNVESITIGDVVEIAAFFAQHCSRLRAFDFSANLKTIGERAFEGCLAMTQIMIQSAELTSVADFAFAGCAGLINFELPYTTQIGEGILKGVFGISEMKIGLQYSISVFFGTYNAAPSSLTTITVLGGVEIPEGYFMNLSALQKVTLSQSITLIRKSAFEGCTALAEVEIVGQSMLSSIDERAFRDCVNLVKFTIRKEIPPALHISAFTGIVGGNDGKLQKLKVYVPSANVEAYATNWQVNVLPLT